jgi:hypothetical protein
MITDAAEMMSAAGMRLAPAGVEWDAVKVGRHLGVRAISLIAEPGAVAVDPARPEPVVYFFVPAGSAAHWDVAQTTALGPGAHVVLPPDHKEAPPGPYWLVPQLHGLTPTRVLRQALIEALRVDLATMRSTARCLLEPDAAPDTLPSAADELEAITHQLRRHLELLAPEVEQLALELPRESVPRYCALACVGEARGKLRASPHPGPSGAAAYARRLARTLNALCGHYEKLRGVGICPACQEPIRDAEPSMPCDYTGPSSPAARSSRTHAGCAKAVRRH